MNKNKNTIIFKCECGEVLLPSHKGLCPKCGKEVKGFNIIAVRNEEIQINESFNRIREFYEENPKIKLLVNVIEVAAIILGLILHGWLGAIVGLIFDILLHRLTPHAVTKVREKVTEIRSRS